MPSKDADQKRKSVIIERLFEKRWDPQTKTLLTEIVTIEDLLEEIRLFDLDFPKGLQPFAGRHNIYAFFKDFVRRSARANANWPDSIFRRGYTARQETGDGKSFRFIKIPSGQTTPFVEPPRVYPRFKEKECRFKIQSLSLDLETRLIGFRSHESWLMQVAVQLRLIQSHLALCSEHKFVEVADLQQNVKQGRAEIDGIFLGRLSPGKSMLITVEAKVKDDILPEQVAAQVTAVMKNKNIKKNLPAITTAPADFYVLPLAMKVIDESVVYIAEYEPIKYEFKGIVEDVSLTAESVCEIVPPVEGIR